MTTDIYLSRVGIRYIGLSNVMMTQNLSSLVFLSSDYDWGVVLVWNTSLSMKFVWLGQALFNMILLRNGKIHDHEQTRIAAFVIISTLKSTISSWCYVSSSFCSILNFKLYIWGASTCKQNQFGAWTIQLNLSFSFFKKVLF